MDIFDFAAAAVVFGLVWEGLGVLLRDTLAEKAVETEEVKEVKSVSIRV